MRHAGMQVIMGNGGGRTSGILRRLRRLRAPAHFLLAQPKAAALCAAAILRWQNACGRTAVFLAPLVCDQQKRRSFRNVFFVGGDKRDRTADLMTASCYRFVVLSVFASNTSIQSAKSTGFFENLPAASTRFYAHLGHNLGQGSRADLERFCRSGRGLWLACCR